MANTSEEARTLVQGAAVREQGTIAELSDALTTRRSSTQGTPREAVQENSAADDADIINHRDNIDDARRYCAPPAETSDRDFVCRRN